MSGFEAIDTIRFFALCSIVWGHCGIEFDAHVFSGNFEKYLQSAVMQLGRFGTIFFFLISGFLIQPRIQTYNTVFFLKSRLRSTILPWAIFVVVFCLLQVMIDMPLRFDLAQGHIKHAWFVVREILKQVIFYYAYWFLLVFLFSSILLIILRKYIYSIWLGGVFAIFTAFYAINLHYNWIDAHHAKAFMGYVLIMWLGVQIRAHLEKSIEWLNRLSWPLLLLVYLLTFWWSCAEAMTLVNKGSVDPYASNRISNICNALVAFTCLYKWGKVRWVNNLQPRKTVYGILLLHVIILFLIAVYGNSLFAHLIPAIDKTGLLKKRLIEFFFTTISCYLLVYLFLRCKNALLRTPSL